MKNHRLATPDSFVVEDIRPPFSNFQYVEHAFGSSDTIRRLFSLSRSFHGKTLVVEDIPATGIIGDENLEISEMYPDYEMSGLKRLSFWACSPSDVRKRDNWGQPLIFDKHTQKFKAMYIWHPFPALMKKLVASTSRMCKMPSLAGIAYRTNRD